MARAKTIKTKYPGVSRLEGEPGKYRLRGEVTNAKNGKKMNLDAVVEAKGDREAATLRLEALARLESELPAQPTERVRLSAYAASWSLAKRASLKKSTRDLYAGYLDNDILPTMGDYFVDAIEGDDLARWRDAQALLMVRAKGATKRPIDPVTVNGRLRFFKRLMRDAVEDLNLPRDPTRRVEELREYTLDEEEDDEEEGGRSLTAPELAELLAHIRVHHRRWYPFFFVLAFTGLRFGELTALKCSDVDHEARSIRVRRAQYKGALDTTKSASKKRKGGRNGKRSLPLFPELEAVIESERVMRREELVARMKRQRVPNFEEAAAGAEADWIFPAHRRADKLMHNTAPARPLHKSLAKLPHLPQDFTVHGLRHTFNNLVRQAAENQGQEVAVRALTGHADIEMTEHYSHVSMAEKATVVGKVFSLVRATG